MRGTSSQIPNSINKPDKVLLAVVVDSRLARPGLNLTRNIDQQRGRSGQVRPACLQNFVCGDATATTNQ